MTTIDPIVPPTPLSNLTKPLAIQSNLQSIIDSILDYAIISLSPDGLITDWSTGATKIKGYSREEIIGQHFSRFYTQADLDAAKPAMELLRAKTEGRYEEEGIRLKKDGTPFFANVIISPLFDPQNQLLGYSKITRDISVRKAEDDRLMKLSEDLARLAVEREAANRELESFSYSISHDLRAPLRHIHGYIDMLTAATAGQLSEKADRYLKIISSASVEMGQLIDDLLAFSRMAKAELRTSSTSLDQLVSTAIRNLENTTTEREIIWKIAPLPEVLGDSSMLLQVLFNLIGNAVKYTRQRNPAVIEIGSLPDENGSAVIFIRDNGAGFDMKYVHKLFGVFQRLHRAEDFEGTGIGLAIVQRVILRHGGRVWAESQVNTGATFFFTLKKSIPH